MLIILTGESASGKSTAAKLLESEHGFNRIVTYTTRPKRPNETDGVDYHFITWDKFGNLSNKGFFFEIGCYQGWEYGSALPKEALKQNSVIILAPAGARKVKKALGDKADVVYLQTGRRERLIKCLQRGDDIDEAYRRSVSDLGQFDGFSSDADHIVFNYHFDKSPSEVCDEIVRGLQNRKEVIMYEDN